MDKKQNRKLPHEVLDDRRIKALSEGDYAKWTYLSKELGYSDFTSDNDPRLAEGELELSQNPNLVKKLEREVNAVYGLFNEPNSSSNKVAQNQTKYCTNIEDLVKNQENCKQAAHQEKTRLTKEGFPYKSLDVAARVYVQEINESKGLSKDFFDETLAFNLAIEPYAQKIDDLLSNKTSISIKNPPPKMPSHKSYFEKEFNVTVPSRNAFSGSNEAYLRHVQDFIEPFAIQKIGAVKKYVSSKFNK